MTESEWLACRDPAPMLALLRNKASDRKLRLFACACCRRIWPFITDPGSQAIVEIAEQWADGFIDEPRILALDYDRLTDNCGGPEEPFATAFMVAGHVGYNLISPLHGFPHGWGDFQCVQETADGAVQARMSSYHSPNDGIARHYQSEELIEAGQRRAIETENNRNALQEMEQSAQCDLLRCIFGNPFAPVAADTAWRNGTIQELAQAIYDTRDFSGMPILADALEDAGCTDAVLLAHCREPGEHVRGCWMLDLLLGKE